MLFYFDLDQNMRLACIIIEYNAERMDKFIFYCSQGSIFDF